MTFHTLLAQFDRIHSVQKKKNWQKKLIFKNCCHFDENANKVNTFLTFWVKKCECYHPTSTKIFLKQFWLVSEFKFTEHLNSKAKFSISQNHASLQFWIVKPFSWPNPIILAISCEITQNIANFSLKIKKNGENVIHGFHSSRKLWNVKSCSHSIHVNFDHHLSLVWTTVDTLSLSKGSLFSTHSE